MKMFLRKLLIVGLLANGLNMVYVPEAKAEQLTGAEIVGIVIGSVVVAGIIAKITPDFIKRFLHLPNDESRALEAMAGDAQGRFDVEDGRRMTMKEFRKTLKEKITKEEIKAVNESLSREDFSKEDFLKITVPIFEKAMDIETDPSSPMWERLSHIYNSGNMLEVVSEFVDKSSYSLEGEITRLYTSEMIKAAKTERQKRELDHLETEEHGVSVDSDSPGSVSVEGDGGPSVTADPGVTASTSVGKNGLDLDHDGDQSVDSLVDSGGIPD
jgi:hypothetical protein